MRDFLLSKNMKFPFKLFGIQHILIIVITIILFLLILIFKKKLFKIDNNHFRILRFIIIFILLSNMLIYRLSYMHYGVYNIKIHLSLYYCHITNYLFIFSLLINQKSFYKIIYGLSWIGAIWTVFFPDFSVGIDCFILYNSFISHNLLLVFTTLIMVIKKIEYNFKDLFRSMIIAIIIVLFTYVVNYDFKTRFNTPDSILQQYTQYSIIGGYDILFFIGITIFLI